VKEEVRRKNAEVGDRKTGVRTQDSDLGYVGIAWKDGGRTRDGLDCAGLAALWLKEQMGIEVGDFSTPVQESALETPVEAALLRTKRDCAAEASRSTEKPRDARKSFLRAWTVPRAAAGPSDTAAGRRRATLDNWLSDYFSPGPTTPRACFENPFEAYCAPLGVPPSGGSHAGPPKGGTPNRISKHAPKSLSRGDIVFFRRKTTGRICHVAVYLGDNHFLHTLRGLESRINTGMQLLERIGFSVAGIVSPGDAGRLGVALRDPNLGDAVSALLIIVSIALSAASSFLLRPKLGQLRNQNGRYGFDQLFTQTSSELPLPDVLGCVTMAGNSPFQSLIDKSQTVGLTDTTGQKVNKVVILGSGPVSGYDSTGILTKINGLQINNPFFYATNPDRGLQLNPNQAKDEAVDGTIGADTNRPSVTYYTGAHDVSVPVDIRAQYDRAFPVYGFSGCAYMVFRLINSVKFPSFNLTTNISSRLCRQFDASGFTVTTVTGESLTGADGSKVRFKLTNWDIKDVSSLTVNGASYSLISPAAQTGNVYSLNQLKGYVEFITAPATSATISITYRY